MRWQVSLLCSALLGCSAAAKAPADDCASFSKAVCAQAGKGDEDICDDLKATVEILSDRTCQVAQRGMAQVEQTLRARKRRCGQLAQRLCRDIGEHTRSCKMVREQTPNFSAERCTEMLAGYGEVLENLRHDAALYRLPPEKAAKLAAGERPALGPAGAPLQLVEFLDFENRDCVRAAEILRDLRAKYGDKLRVRVRFWPLPYDPHAKLAAEASLTAAAQGKFWEYHDALLAHRTALTRADLLRYAAQLGLDGKRFQRELDAHTYAPVVDADLALVKELGISGMPTMFLNGERMLNAVDEQRLIDAIEERLAGP